MQKKELIYLLKKELSNKGLVYCLMLDDFPITSFDACEESRALFAASNLFWAVYREVVSPCNIRIYEE